MTDKVVRVVLQLEGKQYSAELKTSEQQHQVWAGSVTSAADRAGAAMDGMAARSGKALASTGQAGDAAAAAAARQAAQFTQASGRMEISAKQTQAAMRMLPAQFTDIVTSLSSGMPAWQVAIQQGGQIKDSFGGAGAAAKALGSYALGLVNPLALVAAGAMAVGLAYYQGSKEGDGFNRAIVMSGNVAGVTSGQLQAMARGVSGLVGTQGEAAAGLAQMAATGEVAGRNLEAFTATAVRMERVLGQEVAKTVEQFEALGDKPVQASLKLNDQYRYLTAAVFEQIQALESRGRTEEAAEVAQKAFAAAMDERTKRLEGSLGVIERAWNAIKGAAKGAWDSMLNVGRQETPQSQLEAAQKELQSRLARGPLNDTAGVTASWEKGNESLRQHISYLSETVRMEQRGAEAAAESQRQAQAGVEWSRQVLETRSKSKKMDDEIAAARERFHAAGKNEVKDAKELNAVLASIREKYKESNPGAKSLQTNYASFLTGLNEKIAAQQQELQTNRELSVSDKLRIEWTEALKGKLSGLNDVQRQEIETKLQSLEAGEHALTQREGELKLAQQIAAARQQEVAGIDAWVKAQQDAARQTLESLQQRRQALRDEEDAARMSATQHVSLAEAIELVAIKRLEEAQASKFIQGSEGWEAIQKEIDARKELAGMIGSKEAREAAKKTADEAAGELQRVTDQYEQGLTNAAMQGGRSLREYVTGMLRTTAFRILLQPIMAPLAGLVAGATSAMSPQGAGGAASSGLGMLGLLGGGGSSAFAMGLSGAWGAGGGLLSTLNAGASMLGSGSILSGMGTIAGALGPIAIGLMLLSSFIKKSTPHMGAIAQYSAEGGLQTSNEGGAYGTGFLGVKGNEDTKKAVGAVAKTMATTLDGLSKRFGGKGGFEVATGFADDSSKDGAWGALRISRGGRDIINWNETRESKWAPREFADGEAGRKEYEAELAKSMRTAMLDDMPLAKWAKDQLEALGDDVTIESLSAAVDTINAAADAFDTLRAHIQSFAALSEEALASLVAAAGSPQALASGMSSYVSNYYSDEERAAVTRRQIKERMSGLGMEMPTTREGMRALVDKALANVENAADEDARKEAAKTATELLALADAFASVTQSAEAMRRATTDQAMAALQSAVAREREAAQAAVEAAEARVGAGRTLVEALLAEVNDLRGAVAQTSGLAAARGMEIINQALAQVRSGMAPQDLELDLTGAAAAAKGGLATSNFRSRLDWEIAQLTLANRLEELGDAAGKQLTTDEMLLQEAQDQVDYLDQLLKNAKEALDVARGMATGIGDLNATVKAFYDAVTAEGDTDASTGAGGAGSGSGGFSLGPGPAQAAPEQKPGQRAKNGNYIRESFLGTYGSDWHAVSDTEQARLTDLASGLVSQYSGTGDVAGLFNAAREAGFTLSDLATVGGYNYADILARAQAEGIPRFDTGGMHAGGARWVGETSAELEITGPSRILSNRQLGELLRDDGGTTAVVRAIEAMQTMFYDLVRPLILNSGSVEKLMRKFDALGLGVRA